MTDQEILTKAVEQAIAGGWNKGQDALKVKTRYSQWQSEIYIEGSIGRFYHDIQLNTVIFNHDFAKALWRNNYKHTCGRHYNINDCEDHLLPMWQYHLQQMVIADDPIKYLGENI